MKSQTVSMRTKDLKYYSHEASLYLNTSQELNCIVGLNLYRDVAEKV